MLVQVLIPLASLILGSILTMVVNHLSQLGNNRTERKKLIREKIEEIYKLATGVSYWLYAPVYDKLEWETSSLYRSYYRSEPTKEPKQDIERMKLIVNLYFSSLEEIIQEYDVRIDLVILAMNEYKDDNKEELNRALINFQKCHDQLQAQLKKLSGQKNTKVRYTPLPKPLQG